jgi:hypothetical protein
MRATTADPTTIELVRFDDEWCQHELLLHPMTADFICELILLIIILLRY